MDFEIISDISAIEPILRDGKFGIGDGFSGHMAEDDGESYAASLRYACTMVRYIQQKSIGTRRTESDGGRSS